MGLGTVLRGGRLVVAAGPAADEPESPLLGLEDELLLLLRPLPALLLLLLFGRPGPLLLRLCCDCAGSEVEADGPVGVPAEDCLGGVPLLEAASVFSGDPEGVEMLIWSL